MSTTEFVVTWAYRCPFARNFAEHVLVGLANGAPWDVTWIPFALEQTHVAEGEPDVWDDPAKGPALLAIQAGIAVRDQFPERFLVAHGALFAARHDLGLDLRDPELVKEALGAAGVDAEAVMAEVDTGRPMETLRKEHEQAVAEHSVFGVPTVITGGRATFVRVMNRPDGDAEVAVRTVERVLDLVTGWPELNELKHTTISR
ncbi:MAG TPA: DsbA family protein [Acidimicrobiales bacterium]|nr:DsbA family protein [Acidimicrobiales bacterium]